MRPDATCSACNPVGEGQRPVGNGARSVNGQGKSVARQRTAAALSSHPLALAAASLGGCSPNPARAAARQVLAENANVYKRVSKTAEGPRPVVQFVSQVLSYVLDVNLLVADDCFKLHAWGISSSVAGG